MGYIQHLGDAELRDIAANADPRLPATARVNRAAAAAKAELAFRVGARTTIRQALIDWMAR